MKRRRRRGCIRRRYGCFRLPRVKGAAKVMKAKRRDVTWLARTDSYSKTVEFSEHWAHLTPEQRRYIVIHERAHLIAGPEHNERFYEVLRRLSAQAGVDYEAAYKLETLNIPHRT